MASAQLEGLAGEMIYSQNCYDVLGRTFSWRKLDECGGFDIQASRALGEDDPAGSVNESAWFDSEASAGRYLKAATAAGLEPDAADQRLSKLQNQVSARPKSKPAGDPVEGNQAVDEAASRAAAASAPVENGSEDVDGNRSQNENLGGNASAV